MQRKVTLVLSLVVILFISWANVVYFGYGHRTSMSATSRQIIHSSILALTGAIGYYNWRKEANWLKWLWVVSYCAVFVLLGMLAVAVKLTNDQLAHAWTQFVAEIRNNFTGPLPFLVAYILVTLSRRFTPNGNA